MKNNYSFLQGAMLLLCGLLIQISAFGTSLTVAGNIAADVTWNVDTVLVTGNILVEDGVLLTIAPGTRVEFQGHYKLEVDGNIYAVGTPTDTIWFTVADTTDHDDLLVPDGSWLGMRFVNNFNAGDTANIGYCHFSYGKAVKDSAADPNTYYSGSGINLTNSSIIVHVYNSTFTKNKSQWNGAAITATGSLIIIENSHFHHNKAGGVGFGFSGYGGALYLEFDDGSMIRNNIFTNNHSTANGGAITCRSGGEPYLINNLIVNNYAKTTGGGIFFWTFNNTTSQKVYNNVIAYNSAADGGGITCNKSSPEMINNILWGNVDYNTSSPNQVHVTFDAIPTFSHNVVEGDSAGFTYNSAANITVYDNNLPVDPLFTAPPAGAGEAFDGFAADFTPELCSPVFNSGQPDTTGMMLHGPDFGGMTRIQADTVDIGAYEISAVSVQPMGQTICSGDTAMMTAVASEPGSTFQWQASADGSTWSNIVDGAEYAGTLTDSLWILAADDTLDGYFYRALVTTSCPFTAGSDAAVLTFSPPPLSLSAVMAQCATGAPITLSATPSGGIWSGSGVMTGMFDPADSAVTEGINTVYYLFTDTLGCSAMDSMGIEVVPAPFVGADSFLLTCPEMPSIDLSAYLSSGVDTGGTWIDVDGSGALTGSVFDPTLPGYGFYDFAYVIDNGACPADSAIITVESSICAGRASLDARGMISVYPNPTTGPAKVVFSHRYRGVLELSMLDAQGKEVAAIHTQKNQEAIELTLRNDNFPPGIYFVKVTLGAEIWVEKLLILGK